MPAKDLGTKHNCWKCNTKFYDLKKADPVCPKCGADPRAAPVVKAPPTTEKRSRAKAAAEPEVPEVAADGPEVEGDLDAIDEPEEEEADDE